jgi:hypothetical protein
MKRREAIILIGGVVTSWPLAAHAEREAGRPIVAILGDDAAVWSP